LSTGWVTGWIIGPENLLTEVTRIHTAINYNSNGPAQYAFAQALKHHEFLDEIC